MENIILKLDPTKKYLMLISKSQVPHDQAISITKAIQQLNKGEITTAYVPDIDKTLRFVEISENIINVKVEENE